MRNAVLPTRVGGGIAGSHIDSDTTLGGESGGAVVPVSDPGRDPACPPSSGKGDGIHPSRKRGDTLSIGSPQCPPIRREPSRPLLCIAMTRMQ